MTAPSLIAMPQIWPRPPGEGGGGWAWKGRGTEDVGGAMWPGWPGADRLELVGWLGLWLGGSSLLPARRRAVLTARADAGACVWAAACESVCLCVCVVAGASQVS